MNRFLRIYDMNGIQSWKCLSYMWTYQNGTDWPLLLKFIIIITFFIGGTQAKIARYDMHSIFLVLKIISTKNYKYKKIKTESTKLN